MFRLHLNGENTWHITATGDRQALVQELARVMKLEPADDPDGASQLIFTGPNGISSLI